MEPDITEADVTYVATKMDNAFDDAHNRYCFCTIYFLQISGFYKNIPEDTDLSHEACGSLTFSEAFPRVNT
jgi:hypothetical protein